MSRSNASHLPRGLPPDTARRQLRHLYRLRSNLRATAARHAAVRGSLGFIAAALMLAKYAVVKSLAAKLMIAAGVAAVLAFPAIVLWTLASLVVALSVLALFAILTGETADAPGGDLISDDDLCKSLKRRRLERMIAEREAIIARNSPTL